MTLSLFLLVFAVCLVIFLAVLAVLMLSGTPRYRTEPRHLLDLFDRALDSTVSEDEWNAVILYPIRHDEYLEGIRRRARHLVEEHGRFGRVSRGKSLLDPAGHEDLRALRDHLAAHTRLQERRQQP